MTRGRLVTFAALVAALAWALMTVGAYVRVSDSGLGCPDWPACHGQLVAGGHHALIEQVHRWIVTVLSVALVVLAALVYRLRRGERRVTTAMTITLALLGLQVVLGGVTVLLNNVSWTVVLHYGAAAALLAAVLLVVVRLAFPEAESPPRDAYVRLVTWLAGITFGLLLVGATVATTDSHESCGKSFPLCKGSVAPSIDHHVVIHMTHRIWAGVALILALWTWRQTGRLRPGVWQLEAAARGMASLFLAQAAIGVAVVEAGENDALEVLHSSLASLTWLSVATLLWMARTLPAPELARSSDAADRSRWRTSIADYMTLMKPRIMLLILITAFGAMAFAADGLPRAGLVAWTLLGLGLSSGGASAINHYLDRDIDARMTRTAGRPLPSGRVAPEAALGFGAGLIIASMAVLARQRQPRRSGARAVGRVHLRGRLHVLAQAADTAQHRDRRSGGRRAAAGRLGRGDRPRGTARRVHVPDHLPVDAAPLLGARDPHEARVRERGRPDAPRRARRARDGPPDPALHPAARRDLAAPVRRPHVRLGVPDGRGDPRRGVPRARRAAASATRRRPPPGDSSCTRSPTSPCSSSSSGSTAQG